MGWFSRSSLALSVVPHSDSDGAGNGPGISFAEQLRQGDRAGDLAGRAFHEVVEAVVAVCASAPCKMVAIRTGLTARAVRALRDREHAPSTETVMRFAFVYPVVAEVLAAWANRMVQPDLFLPRLSVAALEDTPRRRGFLWWR